MRFHWLEIDFSKVFQIQWTEKNMRVGFFENEIQKGNIARVPLE